jgi:hypothetical protein
VGQPLQSVALEVTLLLLGKQPFLRNIPDINLRLGDSDTRVRDAAADSLSKLVQGLFYAEDWPGQDVLTALVERQVSFLRGLSSRVGWYVGRDSVPLDGTTA